MHTTTRFTLAIALCAATTGSPLLAQQFYGSLDLSYGGTTLGNGDAGGGLAAGSEDGSYSTLRHELSFGMIFADRYYAEVNANGANTDINLTDDSYDDSKSYYLHGGMLFDWGSVGIFGGEVEADYDDSATDTAIRTVFGFEGTFDVNPTTMLFGQIGRIDGTGGNDGFEALTNATYATLGVTHDLGDGFSVSGQFSYVNGQSDGPTFTDVEIYGVGLMGRKEFASVPGLSAYLGIDIGGGRQFAVPGNIDNDSVRERIVKLGITYNFGGDRASSRTHTPSYVENWIALTGGVYE